MNKRSKRYQLAVKDLDPNTQYSASEALELAKKSSTIKFDATIEAHARLNIDPKQTDQAVRFSVNLPKGTGKKVRVAAFVSSGGEKAALDAGAVIAGGDELIAEIKRTEKIDFDVAVAEPAMMKKLAVIAKILGTKGKMPSPKAGTVSVDVGKTVSEIVKGRADVKSDDSGNIHQAIGRVSFDTAALKENYDAFLSALAAAKPKGVKQEFITSVTLSASMGPGFKIKT